MGANDVPQALKQEDYLSGLAPRPTDWVTVWASMHITDTRNGGVSCYLAPPARQPEALQSLTWGGHVLGRSEVWRDALGECVFSDGLSEGEDEFFAHVRSHHGLRRPTVELTPSFLWSFEAVPRPDGSWYYLSDAGAEHELVRTQMDDKGHGRIEVAALPLRRFLAARARLLVLQHDQVVFTEVEPNENLRLAIDDDWCHFQLDVVSDRPAVGKPFSRLLGKSLVLPLGEDPCEEIDTYGNEEGPFPEYIYGVDPESGRPLTYTCEESELTNYFVSREGAPHYLTPVYFRPEVLSRYTQQPTKYSVVNGSVSCLDLWSLRGDVNSEGLVEIFLGDLGKYLPAEEREYWRSFNVRPSGGMNEARFRRDFLSEFIEADDPMALLREGRYKLNRLAEERLGRPIYLPLHPEDQAAWDGLHLMTTSDVAERDRLTVALAKGVVDALDVRLLQELAQRPDGQSLEVLEELVGAWGGDPEECVAPLRLVQALRSSAGPHIRGTRYEGIMRRSGLAEMATARQFETIVRGAGAALTALRDLIESLPDSPRPSAG